MMLVQFYLLGIIFSIFIANVIDQSTKNLLYKYYGEPGLQFRYLVYPKFSYWTLIISSWISLFVFLKFYATVQYNDRDEVSLYKHY